LEDEQTPHPKKKKKKKTIPDIFCNYVFVFQRQVEQLIQRRHGCHETKRDTEIMKRERERERGGKRRSSSRSQGAQQRKQQTQRRNQTTTRDDADCAALDKDYFRAENELPVENKQKMVVGSNFLLIDF
jgi:hypothetical protein